MEEENKFAHISHRGLRWALRRIDREMQFEKTMLFKICAFLFSLALLGSLSLLFIGINETGFAIGFVSVMLLGTACIIMLVYVDVIPVLSEAYFSYSKKKLHQSQTK